MSPNARIITLTSFPRANRVLAQALPEADSGAGGAYPSGARLKRAGGSRMASCSSRRRRSRVLSSREGWLSLGKSGNEITRHSRAPRARSHAWHVGRLASYLFVLYNSLAPFHLHETRKPQGSARRPSIKTLSEQRAESVVDYLPAKGTSAARIQSAGYGDTHPAAPNNNETNRAKNRDIDSKSNESSLTSANALQ
jgi:hypothetical protein